MSNDWREIALSYHGKDEHAYIGECIMITPDTKKVYVILQYFSSVENMVKEIRRIWEYEIKHPVSDVTGAATTPPFPITWGEVMDYVLNDGWELVTYKRSGDRRPVGYIVAFSTETIKLPHTIPKDAEATGSLVVEELQDTSGVVSLFNFLTWLQFEKGWILCHDPKKPTNWGPSFDNVMNALREYDDK